MQVDFRSVYASILDGWMGGGSSTVLGGEYEDLDLFRARPGGGSTPPPPGSGRWTPFADPATLVRQQYLDFLGRPADPGGVTYWVNKLTAGRTIPWMIESFLSSNEFGVAVGPGRPARARLLRRAARLRRPHGLGRPGAGRRGARGGGGRRRDPARLRGPLRRPVRRRVRDPGVPRRHRRHRPELVGVGPGRVAHGRHAHPGRADGRDRVVRRRPSPTSGPRST